MSCFRINPIMPIQPVINVSNNKFNGKASRSKRDVKGLSFKEILDKEIKKIER